MSGVRVNGNITVTELAKMIGRTGVMRLRDGAAVTVQMRIVDVKISYGAVRYQIEPVAGTGRCWIADWTLALDAE